MHDSNVEMQFIHIFTIGGSGLADIAFTPELTALDVKRALWKQGHGSPFFLELVFDLNIVPSNERLSVHGVVAGSMLVVVSKPQRPLFLSCSFDRTWRLWDLECTTFLQEFRERDHAVLAAAADLESMRVLIGYNGGALKLWDLLQGGPRGLCLQEFKGHADAVTCLTVDWTSHRALTASWDQTLRLWSLGSAEVVRTFAGHSREVVWLSASWHAHKVGSASPDGTVRLWDLESGQCLHSFCAGGGILTLNMASDCSSALTGSERGILRLWDLQPHDSKCVKLIPGHQRAIWALATDFAGLRCISGSADALLCLWDLVTSELLHRFEGHSSTVWRVVVDWSAGHVLSASHDRTLKLWRLSDGSCTSTFEGHDNSVVHVTFL